MKTAPAQAEPTSDPTIEATVLLKQTEPVAEGKKTAGPAASVTQAQPAKSKAAAKLAKPAKPAKAAKAPRPAKADKPAAAKKQPAAEAKQPAPVSPAQQPQQALRRGPLIALGASAAVALGLWQWLSSDGSTELPGSSAQPPQTSPAELP